MLKIIAMPNAEKFLSLIRQCCGDVLLHLPDGSRCSLKQDHTAQQLLRSMRPGQDGISISLSDPGDAFTLVKYMIGTAL